MLATFPSSHYDQPRPGPSEGRRRRRRRGWARWGEEGDHSRMTAHVMENCILEVVGRASQATWNDSALHTRPERNIVIIMSPLTVRLLTSAASAENQRREMKTADTVMAMAQDGRPSDCSGVGNAAREEYYYYDSSLRAPAQRVRNVPMV